MIHYQLRCSTDHGFDGWFKDSASFDAQAARGLLECPVCGDAKVERALMSPAVPRKGRAAGKPAAKAAGERKAAKPGGQAAPVAIAGDRMPDQLRSMLQRLRTEVEKNCDYVGPGFAEEARRMHNGETAARGIYGEASPAEAEALAEDGIEISNIPWVPRADG
jgi:hypothetical protein